ncbi:DUF3108 domain-containing protein [Methylophaga sp.]|jgi:hypothetical protein|uniref:DUF3108 domain-containing protein n=1 Tax=Methylophaga sp. TaxID=2024840 RepID=UPI001401A3ED|nr:DUF3108 domain-containing protein [Methylophaga sp.]MTI63986.1 DUF3108 domain-containing protein [Methylophaga sp.]
MLRLFSYILLFCLSNPALASDIPDFSANYLVRLNGIQAGELKRTLTTQENGLRKFSSVSQAKGVFSFFKPDVIEETSVWKLVDDRVTPQRYRYQRTGGKKDKFLQMQFNWRQKQVSIDDREHPWELDIKTGVLDKLVYQISLMRDLNKGIKQVDYLIADGGHLKTYEIKVLARETITTPMGQIETIKLTRHREKPNDRETTLWCAPALGYLPVKLEHVEDEAVFTAVLRRLQGIDTEQAFTSLQPAKQLSNHE